MPYDTPVRWANKLGMKVRKMAGKAIKPGTGRLAMNRQNAIDREYERATGLRKKAK